MGPRTGRAAGYCSGFDAPGFMNGAPQGGGGRGLGFGGGRGGGGRGWRNRFYATGQPGWMRGDHGAETDAPEPTQDTPFLARQLEALKAQMSAIEERLNQALGGEAKK
jgi:hypothetical protein